MSILKSLLVGLCMAWSVVAAANQEAPAVIDGVATVTLSEAKSLYDNGAVFIDVRDAESWSLGHIDGAINLDFNAYEFAVLYSAEDLDRDTPLVFYTSSPLNTTSAIASFFATSWGYKNVYYFRQGFYSWMAADLPVELKMAGRSQLSLPVIR